MIPHFEKMLYDNGSLLAVYAQAALATGDPPLADIAVRTAEWAMREMQSPKGGYYSSFDASSEGHEGKFYVWVGRKCEVRSAMMNTSVFAPRFGLDRAPNFEGVASACLSVGRGHCRKHGAYVARSVSSCRAHAPSSLRSGSKRVWPGRDDKILTSWNALMIRGLAIAARAFGREDFAASPPRAPSHFIRSTHVARWPAACDLQGRARASERVPG
jgi:uncharacterized protein YyaL (SSP411 family)